MLIKIKRFQYSANSTIGRLFINGHFHCFTLEDTFRRDGIKLYGATCIPEGTYLMRFEFSAHFKKVMPFVFDVENFSGIMFHVGNSHLDTKGCILLGQTFKSDFVGSSKAAFDNFVKSTRNNNGIQLTISNT